MFTYLSRAGRKHGGIFYRDHPAGLRFVVVIWKNLHPLICKGGTQSAGVVEMGVVFRRGI